MYKRSVRQKSLKQNKENSGIQQEEQQDKQPARKNWSWTPYYLIVEAAASPSVSSEEEENHPYRKDRSQYWFINSKDILDIPVINSTTVYTGKQLKFQGPKKVCSGTCVVFSSDFSFVETQFRQITSTVMDTENINAPLAPPLVLNNSTRGNILNINMSSNGGLGVGKRHVKVPSVITIKSIPRTTIKKEQSEDILQLGDPDAENRPPGQEHVTIIGGGGSGRVMTFDQQSQTDTKMYEIPATAAQMHQQSTQIAQLIRANNGLVVEVRQLTQSNKEMQELMLGLDKKLGQALSLLSTPATKTITECQAEAAEPAQPLAMYVESFGGPEEVVENYEFCETSVDRYSVVNYSSTASSTAPPSREVSVARSVKSENTPPLKKNKAKLNTSIRMAVAQENLNQSLSFTEGDYQQLGNNGTLIHKSILQQLNFENPSAVTRKILSAVFDRETLASHSLTGKPSPAFLERGAKMPLDAQKVEDIVNFIAEHCGVNETVVRGVITSKCADENKMLRLQKKRESSSSLGAAPVEPSPVPNKRRTIHLVT